MKKTLTKLSIVAAAGAIASPATALTAQADTQEILQQSSVVSQTSTAKELTLSEAQEQLSLVQIKADEAEKAYQPLEDKATELESQLEKERGRVESLNQEIVQLEKQVQSMEEEVPRAETNLKEAQAIYETEATKNPELTKELEQAVADNDLAVQKQTALEEKVATAQESIKAKQADLATKEMDLAAVQSEVARTQAKLQESEAALQVELSAVETAQNQLAATETQVATNIAKLEEEVRQAGSDTVVSTRTLRVTSVDGSQQVENNKSPKHEQVIYAGTKAIEKELTPDQLREYKSQGYFTYQPDVNSVSQYMVTMLNELRALNGIDLPVPEVSAEAMAYANQRAVEINKNQVLSHDTILDTTDRNGENAGIMNIAMASNAETPILSDEQMAYHLLNLYFADYENLYSGYGHRVTLLTASGNGLGNGFSGRYHVMDFIDSDKLTETTDFSRKYWEVMGDFSYANNVENTMFYKGKRLTFLPRTTFTYVTKITEANPNTAKAAAKKALDDYLLQAQNLLVEARNGVEQTQEAVGARRTRLTDLTNRLSTLTASLPELVQAVDQAKETVTSAEATKLDLDSELEAVVATATSKKALLDSLSHKAQSLVLAKENLYTATKKVSDLKLSLLDQNTRLSSLTTARDKSQNQVILLKGQLEDILPQRDQAKRTYDQAQEELNTAQQRLSYLEITSLLKTAPVKSGGGDVTPTIQTSKASSQVIKKESSQATPSLPATGEASSLLLTGLGLLMSTVGLTRFKRED
ncbi:LPXTG cell wall anchor domain-containing protein [Streptococcus sp. E17BB]|uniref:LPXTG cell wall anchor domain-containing protein n=1 Tax=Streptococcus sp. E17BB TaxID=3278714 RepID=UPI00359CD718